MHSSDGVEPKYAPHIVQQLNLTSSAAYLAQEIYGMDEEAGAGCLAYNIKDALLPCRHLCVCSSASSTSTSTVCAHRSDLIPDGVSAGTAPGARSWISGAPRSLRILGAAGG